jgi:hypothetical protein
VLVLLIPALEYQLTLTVRLRYINGPYYFQGTVKFLDDFRRNICVYAACYSLICGDSSHSFDSDELLVDGPLPLSWSTNIHFLHLAFFFIC